MAIQDSAAYVTPAEHAVELALQELPLTILAKTLAQYTDQERELSKQLNSVKADADRIEKIVIDRMVADDLPSLTVEYSDEGKRMKLTISSKTYPKMVNGSHAAAIALERYADRLAHEGRDDEADAVLNMLTIKGQSLAPLLSEWLMNEDELPPEFEGAIEPSMRMSLSKTSAGRRAR